MGSRTTIEWTDATWTPIRARNRATGKVGWHCERVSPGCEHCYSEVINAQRLGTRLPFKPGHRADVELYLDEAMLLAPLRWARPRRIFVCSMTDLFGEFVPDAMIDRVFAVMALAPQHTFQVLTKRSARMRSYLTADRRHAVSAQAETIADGAPDIFKMRAAVRAAGVVVEKVADPLARRWPLSNVWLGVSTEDQRRADERVPDLLATPAAVRFVSAEPLLGPINFRMIAADDTGEIDALEGLSFCQGRNEPAHLARLDQIIVGGENGPDARPMHTAWARAIRDQCDAPGVPFLFKQWGTYLPEGQSTGAPIGRINIFKRRWCTAEDGDDRYTRDAIAVHPVGKKRAGRLLDGVEHNGMPGGQP